MAKKSLLTLENIAANDFSKRNKKNRASPKNKNKEPLWIVTGVGALITLTVLGWIYGGIPYGLKYIECGKPPTTITLSDYWSGSSTGIPQEPGDSDYGPGIGKTYTCTAKKGMYPDNSPRR